MKTQLALVITLAGFILTSCRTLTSTTYIDANNSFVLGNNEHGSFSVRLKNASSNDVEVHRAPIAGGTHTYETIKPGQTVNVSVEKDCALVIDNKSTNKATVELLVKGDTGLSMGYKK
jgi:hypothetical protein